MVVAQAHQTNHAVDVLCAAVRHRRNNANHRHRLHHLFVVLVRFSVLCLSFLSIS